MVRDSVVLNPEIGFIEAIRKSADVRLPVTNEKVKVVRAIALRQVCWIGSGLSLQRNGERHPENERHQDPEFAHVHGDFTPSRLL